MFGSSYGTREQAGRAATVVVVPAAVSSLLFLKLLSLTVEICNNLLFVRTRRLLVRASVEGLSLVFPRSAAKGPAIKAECQQE